MGWVLAMACHAWELGGSDALAVVLAKGRPAVLVHVPVCKGGCVVCMLRPWQPPNLRPLNPNPPSSLGLQSELRTNIEAVLNHVFNKHEEVGAGRCCTGWSAGGGLAAWCRCGVCRNAGGRGRAAVGSTAPGEMKDNSSQASLLHRTLLRPVPQGLCHKLLQLAHHPTSRPRPACRRSPSSPSTARSCAASCWLCGTRTSRAQWMRGRPTRTTLVASSRCDLCGGFHLYCVSEGEAAMGCDCWQLLMGAGSQQRTAPDPHIPTNDASFPACSPTTGASGGTTSCTRCRRWRSAGVLCR